MTNVIIATKRPIQISTGGTAGLIQTTAQVALKNNPPQASLAIEQLTNVVSTGETSGDVLIYDAVSRKWVTRKLDLQDVSGNLDGGNF